MTNHPPRSIRRAWLQRGLLALGLAAAASGPALGQGWPTKPITLVVPFAAGGPTDVIARIVTGQMAPGLGQSIIIENVVGAGGTTGATRAARAANDGYTFITGHMGTHAVNVGMYRNIQYDPRTIRTLNHPGIRGGSKPLSGFAWGGEQIDVALRAGISTALQALAADECGLVVGSEVRRPTQR